MGKQKEKIKESKYIHVNELFSNQCCPLCGAYTTIMAHSLDKGNVKLYIICLNKDCTYSGTRTLI